MNLISSPEEARRQARLIGADIVVYYDHVIRSGLVEGNLDSALEEALREASDYYESRVDPELVRSTNFLERAITERLLREAGAFPTWRLALSRIRARLLPHLPCGGCGFAMEPSRLVGSSKLHPDADPAPVWRFLFACPSCLAVCRFDWTEGWSAATPSGLEATGSLVARARERLRSAGEAGRLREELEFLMGHPERRWLLSVPEIFEGAAPALGQQIRLKRHLEVVDRDPNGTLFYPSPYLDLVPSAFPEMPEEIFPWHKRGGHARHLESDVLLAGTRLPLLGARGGGWLVGRTDLLIGRHWRAIDGFCVEAELVALGGDPGS